MKIIFIFNPQLDRKKKERIGRICDQMLPKENFRLFDEDIRLLTVEELSRYDCFVAVGGDGTIYHTVNAMMKTISRKLAIIPAGSGNDFARSLKLKSEPEAVIKAILSGKSHAMDVVRWNDRYFLNIASVGLDADVNAKNSEALKKIGSISYRLSLIKTVLSYRFRKIHTDHLKETEWTIFTFGNGGYYGGGFPIFKDADPFSGRLLFLGAGKSRLKWIVPFLVCLFLGKGDLFKKDMFRSDIQSMDFEILEEANVNLDGENFLEKGKVHVEILPSVINYVGP